MATSKLKGIDEPQLEGGISGGAGSGRMTATERWAKRSDPNFDWASLTGPKIPKEVKEERAARFKAERDSLMEYMNKIPKTLTDEQKAAMSPAQLRRAERAQKNFADKFDAPSAETPEGKKKGGTVSASRRADGIAQRGKTRGKIV